MLSSSSATAWYVQSRSFRGVLPRDPRPWQGTRPLAGSMPRAGIGEGTHVASMATSARGTLPFFSGEPTVREACASAIRTAEPTRVLLRGVLKGGGKPPFAFEAEADGTGRTGLESQVRVAGDGLVGSLDAHGRRRCPDTRPTGSLGAAFEVQYPCQADAVFSGRYRSRGFSSAASVAASTFPRCDHP